jgi:hypothetical protein
VISSRTCLVAAVFICNSVALTSRLTVASLLHQAQVRRLFSTTQ